MNLEPERIPWLTELARAASFTLPVLVGLATHGLCIKYRLISSLAVAIDGGRTVGGKPWFGPNKTYRGLLAVAIGTAIGFLLRALLFGADGLGDAPSWLARPGGATAAFGFGVGLAAMLAELPNSFIKRRLGVAPGTPGLGRYALIFYVADQVDLLLGMWLVESAVTRLSVAFLCWSALLLFAAHQMLTALGYRLGMRATQR